MEIRQLQAGDDLQLRQLILGVYADSPLAMWFESRPTDDEIAALFAGKIESIKDRVSVDLVAVEQGKIVGECEIVISGGSGSVGVIVEAGHRRKGIGERLMSAGVENAARIGASRIIAEVIEDNLAGRGFFEKHGFVVKGVSDREFIRGGREHEVILMEKIIR